MDSAQSLLSLSNLTLARNSVAVVTDGHLAVNKGECVCLVGPNGSGKTTLAELLAGVSSCTVSSGSVMFRSKHVTELASLEHDGLCKKNNFCASAPAEQSVLSTEKNLLLLTPAERARQGLYVAFQQVPEFDGVTAETFLYEAYAACHGLRPLQDDFRTTLDELCSVVGLSRAHLERPLFKGFSGGERKRFQLLELLLLRPRLALLDELDAGLDAEGLQLFFEIIKVLRLKDTGCAFLIITHNQSVVDALAPDRVYELSDNRLRELPLCELSEKRSKGGGL